MTQTWQQIQDKVITEIRVAMVRRKLSAKELCGIVEISQAHWSRLSNCKSPLLMDDLAKMMDAVGIEIEMTFKETTNQREL